MHFTIVGAGALGTILGAHLVASGHQVSCVVRANRAQQLRMHGLQIEGLQRLSETCSVVTDPSAVQQTDVLIVGVKTYQTAAAIGSLAHLKPQLAFSVANGVKKTKQMIDVFGKQATIGCMANISGELLADGKVDFTRNVCLHIGALENSQLKETAELARLINEAGIVCRAEKHIQCVEWSKFVGWVAFMALAVITRAKTADYLLNPSIAALACRLIKEMAAIAQAQNIPLVDQSPMPVRTIADHSLDAALQAILDVGREFATNAPAHRMSSLQDLQRGAQLEFEDTLGYAVELAKQYRLPAPTINDCYDLVAGIDAINRGSAAIQ